MGIEVATLEGATNKQKGDLLEEFAQKFLQALSYRVERNVRALASELDLECCHKVNGRKIYVQCKAHRDPLSANDLTELLGTVSFHHHQEGWLVSTGPLGRDAKGFKSNWEARELTERQRLSIYDPERIIQCFADVGIIKYSPQILGNSETPLAQKSGEPLLLICEYGYYWLVPILEGGVPAFVNVYEAQNGTQIVDMQLLSRISATDCSLHHLDFERAARTKAVCSITYTDRERHRDTIVEVATGDSWNDYRPARPQDFIGRTHQQEHILRLFENVRTGKTKTRVFAVTGDSGMGKSSLIAKLRQRASNKRNMHKFFVYAVDARAARNSSYVLSSLLECLRAAIQSGFGENLSGGIDITDTADPLSSESVNQYLLSLSRKNQVVCLVFDQFEELYSKSELFEVFEEAQRLFMSAVAATSNLVLGFAWRSDSTVPQDHPAYYMWHRLADHRIECSLGAFDYSESAHAVSLFAKVLRRDLHPELRRQVIENSRGYPWLLKKLCIHIYDQILGGTEQSDLCETLDAATLFEYDMQHLTPSQVVCLKAIAQSAPAEWSEMIDTYSLEVLRALQDRRLVVRSGDRINVYWDIFREYLLTHKTPAIPFTYLPSSPSLTSLLRVADQLRHDQGKSVFDLSLNASLSAKTVGNIIRDLRMFGIAVGQLSSPKLSVAVKSGSAEEVLQKIRDVLRRHALTRHLSTIDFEPIVTLNDIREKLIALNPGANHRLETWSGYAERIVHWLEATGFLKPIEGNRWQFNDFGGIPSNAHLLRRRTRNVFTGEAPPASVVSALDLTRSEPRRSSEMVEQGYRNALSVLLRLGIIDCNDDGTLSVVKGVDAEGSAELLWRSMSESHILDDVLQFILEFPKASGEEIGRRVAEQHSQDWSKSSMMRTGNALRRWVEWFLKSKSGTEEAALRSNRRSRGRGSEATPDLFTGRT